MNVLLLVVALATPVDAPKAGLPAVAAANAAVLPAGGVLPAAASAVGCALVDLFKGDAGFLTGPWGAAWRLEAARKRGDSAAARHLETTLDALLVEAAGGGE